MKAMILAAGIGSRLRPLTDHCPKALVELNGVPMLEIVIRRLLGAGVDELVVNVFHLPEMIVNFLKSKRDFGIRIEVSRERELLDTGGGLKKVAHFFDDGAPFFLHNVDVVTDIDLSRMYRFHLDRPALATLAVQAKTSSRYLLFDGGGQLCGWESVVQSKRLWAGAPVERAERLAFTGIHVVSPEIFPRMSEGGVFPIIRTYLGLAGRGERIQSFRADEWYWADIGGPAKLEEVRRQVRDLGVPI
ncbi:MAG TPA: nucleotidyltransferase family protein [Methylomirabilota bacterium]|jgi:NDP-sugar pyrophosphorylase family protein|nr:nucleotidyltransferase family protein [Methylomirabilota bacterium]